MDDELEVTAGQSFDVRLPSLPSAGFRWTLRPGPGDQELVIPTGESWETDDTPAVGGTGHQRFSFTAGQPGTAELTFDYGRSFDAQPTRSRTIKVRIK
jgi:inhibitor of cysteine peptidase